MKKLLILTLVLGVASLATAGLTASKTVDVEVGDVITISYLAEVVTNGVTLRSIDDDVAGLATTGAELVYSGYNFALKVGDGKGTGGKLYDGGTSDSFAGSYFSLLGAGSDAGIGEALWSFAYTVPTTEAATITITIGAGTVTPLGDSAADVDGENVVLTMSTIPEPATMALLGLGALVLRRKK